MNISAIKQESETVLMCGKIFSFFFFLHQMQTTTETWRTNKVQIFALKLLFSKETICAHWGIRCRILFFYSVHPSVITKVTIKKLTEYFQKASISIMALLWSYCFKPMKRQTEKNYVYEITLVTKQNPEGRSSIKWTQLFIQCSWWSLGFLHCHFSKLLLIYFLLECPLLPVLCNWKMFTSVQVFQVHILYMFPWPYQLSRAN